MRAAIVIGHTNLSKGAFSDFFGVREYDFWKRFECELRSVGSVFYHNSLIKGYNSRQIEMASKNMDYDIVFEVHFNAANKQADGCEALYYKGNDKTKHISNFFCLEYSGLSNVKNRGVKPLSSSSQRGFGFVYHQKTNAIILEPFFGDNHKDCSKFEISNFITAIKKSIQ